MKPIDSQCGQRLVEARSFWPSDGLALQKNETSFGGWAQKVCPRNVSCHAINHDGDIMRLLIVWHHHKGRVEEGQTNLIFGT